MILGIFTAVLIVLFLGIVGWAYSGRRRDDFADAASLPLIQEIGTCLETESHA